MVVRERGVLLSSRLLLKAEIGIQIVEITTHTVSETNLAHGPGRIHWPNAHTTQPPNPYFEALNATTRGKRKPPYLKH
jgi:hypothetical protein